METQNLKGGELARQIKEKVKAEVAALKARGLNPKMCAIAVGSDPSVESYIKVKEKVAGSLGVEFTYEILASGASQEILTKKLQELSFDPAAHGIILELPLPVAIDTDQAIAAIAPQKDVDGLTATNLGLAMAGNEKDALLSATAQACVALAESLGPLAGKRIALIGKGRTVGKPLIPMLLNRGATLTICHSKTADLKAAIREAEIVICGVGKPGLVNGDLIQEGQIVIDAGGDTTEDIWGKARAATPLIDGVGPLTTAFLFQNLLKAIELQHE